MGKSSFSDTEREFDIHEVDIIEQTDIYENQGLDPEAPVKLNRRKRMEEHESEGPEVEIHIQRRRRKFKKAKRKNEYGWAFFLCSLFLGIAFTATTEIPAGVLAGLGIGFLFFVDPIYQKVMDKIEKW